MTSSFLENLVAACLAPSPVQTVEQRRLIGRAIADTIAVAAAGFVEPVTRKALHAYAGTASDTWSGAKVESVEAAVLVNGIAAHALDYDDVYLESLAHISTVLVPTVLTGPTVDTEAAVEAVASGLIAAKAVARRVGRGHYRRGWHGTGTIGAFAAAAAAGRLRGLSAEALGNAFGLVASLSGGLRVNFSTEAKPAHAGFAASAGLRAARLAAAGVTASPRVFSDAGFAELYGVGDGEQEPGPDAFELRPDRVSVKLYPCCYATHRMVGLALDARAALGPEASRAPRIRLEVPEGGLEALVQGTPTTSLQAKFSAEYCLATTLVAGAPGLDDFSDEATGRRDVLDVMRRVEVVEDASQPGGSDIEAGEMRLILTDASGGERRFARTAIPGSPDDPPSDAAMRAKIAGCLAVFERTEGRPFPLPAMVASLDLLDWFPKEVTCAP